jgi:ABC-2 type transport system ATP-binding protein
MSHSVLSAKGIVKRFRRKTVLEELDFNLQPGAVTVLLGRNGAGKSTFLRLALGVLKSEAGTISVCGMNPLRRGGAVRRAVGFVPDRPDVYDWMTPRDLYRFLRPQYPTWNDDRVARTVESLQVPIRTRFKNLSRGEGMKAMLVAALAHEPELLLLDEPFAGLDPVVRDEVLRGVITELKTGQRTVLCATHDLDVTARIADFVAVLGRGRIDTYGGIHQVLGADGEPAHVPERIKGLLAEVSS